MKIENITVVSEALCSYCGEIGICIRFKDALFEPSLCIDCAGALNEALDKALDDASLIHAFTNGTFTTLPSFDSILESMGGDTSKAAEEKTFYRDVLSSDNAFAPCDICDGITLKSKLESVYGKMVCGSCADKELYGDELYEI